MHPNSYRCYLFIYCFDNVLELVHWKAGLLQRLFVGDYLRQYFPGAPRLAKRGWKQFVGHCRLHGWGWGPEAGHLVRRWGYPGFFGMWCCTPSSAKGMFACGWMLHCCWVGGMMKDISYSASMLTPPQSFLGSCIEQRTICWLKRPGQFKVKKGLWVPS